MILNKTKRPVSYTHLDVYKRQVLNDGVNQGKAVVQLSANLANGKAATEGTQWKLENRVVRILYVGVDKDNLSEFLK